MIRPMPGARIHHREKRNCTVQIPHMGRLTPAGPKLYNIRLDAQGDCIVSPTVLERLTEACGLLGYSPFVVLDEVKAPPTIVVGGKTQVKRVYQLIGGELREQTPQREALHLGRPSG